ncbi:MAG TPA: DedA family protein [Candidatus Nanoarchaeia archaeon]|nr:DedA family protein [Candidatus Nanoarchaeia archaeon]
MSPLDLIPFILHIDQYISLFLQSYGILTYFILFAIIFIETGLVIMPFLPGDSLLFVAGAFAAKGDLNIFILLISLTVAAILGDSLNYALGTRFGEYFTKKNWIKEAHLKRTQHFFETYGGKTIILARFVPIIRTIAPFVAGIGSMSYKKFLSYNIIGGILWISLLLLAGFFLGSFQLIQDNLTLVILIIVFLSILPAIIEYLRERKAKP